MLLPFYAKSALLFDPTQFAEHLLQVSPLTLLLPWTTQAPEAVDTLGQIDWTEARNFREAGKNFADHLLKRNEQRARQDIQKMAALVSGMNPITEWKPVVYFAKARGQSWAWCARGKKEDEFQSPPELALSSPRNLFQRARFIGYHNEETLEYCLRAPNPLDAAKRIENRMADLIRDPFFLKGKNFADLTTEDQLALFSLAFSLWPDKFTRPDFDDFSQWLGVEMELPGLTEIPFPQWSWNFVQAQTDYLSDNTRFRILGRLLRIHRRTPLSKKLVKEIRNMLPQRYGAPLFAFDRYLFHAKNREMVEAALVLLRNQIRDNDIGLELMKADRPANAIEEYLERLQVLRNPPFNITDGDFRSKNRRLALETIVLESIRGTYFDEDDKPLLQRLKSDDDFLRKALAPLELGYSLGFHPLSVYLASRDKPNLAGRIRKIAEKIFSRRKAVTTADPDLIMGVLCAVGHNGLTGSDVNEICNEVEYAEYLQFKYGVPPPFLFSAKTTRTLLTADQVQTVRHFCREVLEFSDPGAVLQKALQNLPKEAEQILEREGPMEKKFFSLYAWMYEHGIWNKIIFRWLLMAQTWDQLAPAVQSQFKAILGNEQPDGEATVKALDVLNDFYREVIRTRQDVNIQMIARGVLPQRMEPDTLFDFPPALREIDRTAPQTEGEQHFLNFVPSKNWIDAFFAYAARNCIATPDYAIYTMQDERFLPIRIMLGSRWVGSIMTFTFQNIGEPGQRFQKALVITGIDPQESYQPKPFLDNLLENMIRIAKENGYDAILVPENAGAQSSRRFLEEEIRSRNWLRLTLDTPVGFPKKGPGTAPQDYYGLHRNFLIAWSKKKG